MSPSDATLLLPEEIAARSGSNFLAGFTCLPAPRRAGMTAIYAFCRVVDDAVDEACDPTAGGERLSFWRHELEQAERGAPATAVGRALQRTWRQFGGTAAPLHELLLGMEMDLHGATYEDLAALEVYCHRAAAAVGHACLPVLGVGERAATYAEHLGHALQLTNILRDLRTDALAGRVYVPRDWLRDCDVDPDWLRGSGPAKVYQPEGAVGRLCARLAAAAGTRFAAARSALQRLPFRDRRRLLPARIMAAVYRDLLQRLRRRGGDVRGERVRVPRWRKIWLVAASCVGADA